MLVVFECVVWFFLKNLLPPKSKRKSSNQAKKVAVNGWIDFFNSFQPCHFDRSGEKKDFTLWQSDNHPIEVYSLRVIEQKLAYIHLNPVREDIVAQPEHYLHSSASNYVDGTGLLNVIVIDPMSDVGYLHL